MPLPMPMPVHGARLLGPIQRSGHGYACDCSFSISQVLEAMCQRVIVVLQDDATEALGIRLSSLFGRRNALSPRPNKSSM